ncbi:MAG: hypothetical protein QM628_16325, partial [Propionicimonas sp.]
MAEDDVVAGTGVLLAKIRATQQLAAARIDIEPLREPVEGARRAGLALDGSPQWFRVPSEPAASPW